ncbi:hypothetical protein B0T19DRAFT_396014 [Cercophora scortea]|uniref:Uncharacterized protein n=1 Tax=Cercophora scortea TaxID=314031 RepID=A0AAE0MKS3_9PEZI|nr:hypothetical protein B0T19DRAFT_396014 [Cercophora scortea]
MYRRSSLKLFSISVVFNVGRHSALLARTSVSLSDPYTSKRLRHNIPTNQRRERRAKHQAALKQEGSEAIHRRSPSHALCRSLFDIARLAAPAPIPHSLASAVWKPRSKT